MTSNSNLKKTIRARQADTGETYTEARRHITQGRRPVGAWADAALDEVSALAGARRAAAAGCPVILIDDGTNDNVIRFAERFNPTVIDDDLIRRARLNPWNAIADPSRAAAMTALLLRIASLVPDDEQERHRITAVLTAAAEHSPRLSLDQVLPTVGVTDQELRSAFLALGAVELVGNFEPLEVRAGSPVIVRGSLAEVSLSSGEQSRSPAGFGAVRLSRVLDVLAGLGEPFGNTYIVYRDGAWWRSAYASTRGLYRCDSYLAFPDHDLSAPTPTEVAVTDAGSAVEWKPEAGAHLIISATHEERAASTFLRFLGAADHSGSAIAAFTAGSSVGHLPARSTTAAEFEAELIAAAEQRLVNEDTATNLVIAVSDIHALIRKVQVSPRPAPSLPVSVRRKIDERVNGEEDHNARVDAILSLLDTFVRQGEELNVTVAIAGLRSNGEPGDIMAMFGSPYAWRNATSVWSFSSGDEASRGRVQNRQFSQGVQFYV